MKELQSGLEPIFKETPQRRAVSCLIFRSLPLFRGFVTLLARTILFQSSVNLPLSCMLYSLNCSDRLRVLSPRTSIVFFSYVQSSFCPMLAPKACVHRGLYTHCLSVEQSCRGQSDHLQKRLGRCPRNRHDLFLECTSARHFSCCMIRSTLECTISVQLSLSCLPEMLHGDAPGQRMRI